MGIKSIHLSAGLALALAASFPGSQAGAQSAAPELMLNNSIIHPETPMPGEVHYCFSDHDLKALANQDGVGVIVHHGRQQDVPDFSAIYSHTERLDFFTPQSIDPMRVTPDMVGAILGGDVTNWAQVGGADQAITVYHPAQGLKKDAIAAQLRRVGVWMQVEGEERATYADLAKALEDDPGAFVMGLRSKAAWEENLPDARRIIPTNKYGQAAFAMPIQIYVKTDDPAAQNAATELLSVVGARAEQDRMAFPVADRLQALGLGN